MGSSGSKDSTVSATAASSCASSSSLSTVARVVRWRGPMVFHSSCLGKPPLSSLSSDSDDEQESHTQDENGRIKNELHLEKLETDSFKEKNKRQKKIKVPLSEQGSSDTSNVDYDACNQEGTSHNDTAASSSIISNQEVVDGLSNPLKRSRSPFRFISDMIGFRLGRTASLGSSSGGRPFFSENLFISNSDENSNHIDSTAGVSDDNPSINVDSTSADAILDEYTNHIGYESIEPRRQGRRSGVQETLEGSIRFSRTLSVGRLRDRVLRRTSFSEGLFGSMLEDESILYNGCSSGRQMMGGLTRNEAFSDRDSEMTPTYTVYGSANGIHDQELDIMQSREARMHELTEQRSAFLERRRRIRSQV
ncbi:hypothetical protein QJS10_CPA01g03055 [Acorus calamus]|uniref:Uncharacterized protein n=1 Tax=Acorus calamus TaxID=4465 RepID=A0AAV9FLV0_ACOCL|nr:hypothetical protein QJS10_CPA01g03055 [Acorus calamus]